MTNSNIISFRTTRETVRPVWRKEEPSHQSTDDCEVAHMEADTLSPPSASAWGLGTFAVYGIGCAALSFAMAWSF